ncbi:LAQU0S07e00276g1_1 [Lachancea quebecensis]|uniref:LAQU0S07e00276g1_1 n=1 Tax=Lachancea quebecensis TaxID=1654605 RepID=A0A0P1KS92_9SACH|nr:LAQU0S07e00276g1_1 [Lachancea quebecensis]
METAKNYFKSWFKPDEPRKVERGSLDKWRKRSQTLDGLGGRGARRGRTSNTLRNKTTGKSLRPKRTAPAIWNLVKGVFSREDQDLREMKNAYTTLKLRDNSRGMQTRSQVQRRIASSAALKRKLLEKQYDEKRLDELRRGRKPGPRAVGLEPRNVHQPNFDTDRVILLQHKADTLTTRLYTVERELHLTLKRLKFTQEKNALLESLLNDANVDDDYLKSRRRITNLQKDNLKPEYDALPPSPHRALSPLVTSSPRKVELPQDNFYEKYRSIPTAELLRRDPESSLSPIRVDLSKYSSSRAP